jgi:ferritin-like metal-binding protein YciE
MTTANGLQDLFLTALQEIYHGEKQILRALPIMAKSAGSSELKRAFEHHADQTEGQIGRLQRVFELMHKTARGKTCEAMAALIEDSKDVMSQVISNEAMDAGLSAAAQAVEHYEIARYGTLCAWARQLGLKEAAHLLGQTLREEKQTDEILNKIALGAINRKAA